MLGSSKRARESTRPTAVHLRLNLYKMNDDHMLVHVALTSLPCDIFQGLPTKILRSVGKLLNLQCDDRNLCLFNLGCAYL